jgi:hypothetical protein
MTHRAAYPQQHEINPAEAEDGQLRKLFYLIFSLLIKQAVQNIVYSQ